MGPGLPTGNGGGDIPGALDADVRSDLSAVEIANLAWV